MAERLFGVETEYGFSVLARPGGTVTTGLMLEALLAAARQKFPHLPAAQGSGIFLQNGSRFYIDSGGHPEWTTPECANPWDICRYQHAADQMLTELAADLTQRDPQIAELLLMRNNVDYTTQATWGSHESYLHRSDPNQMPDQIVPHLDSRIVFAGAGGFNAFSTGLEFLLSPRVMHLRQAISGSSTSDRGIFHTKDEPLSTPGYHRLHVLSGESLNSEIATFLRIGTTALVVALIDAGRIPGAGMKLADPVQAMRAFAGDPTCRATALTTRGTLVTAIDIQRHYLQQAESCVGLEFMPPWSDRVCREWRAMLDRLAHGAPVAVATELDWAIKYCLYRDQAARRGVPWELWPVWTEIVSALCTALQETPLKGQRVTTDVILGPNSPVADTVARLTPLLQQHGLAWTGLDTILRLRQQLFEADTRFGQLGSKGIFAALDRAGTLHHRFPGVDNVAHAIANPPAVGRAQLRSRYIKAFAGHNGSYACDWGGVWDRKAQRFLDLADPFATDEKWVPTPAPPVDDRFHFVHAVDAYLREVDQMYELGQYDKAHDLLAGLDRHRGQLEAHQLTRYLCLRARVQARRGFLDGPQLLNEIASRLAPPDLITDYVCVYRFSGLAPAPGITEWINRGRLLLASAPDTMRANAGAFLGHVAYAANRAGHPQEALDAVRDALRPDRWTMTGQRCQARLLAERGEAYRLLGQPRVARHWLLEARRLQWRGNRKGELADFTLTYRAKLEPDRRRALPWLLRAKKIQLAHRNIMGQARTAVLRARWGDSPACIRELNQIVRDFRELRPALAQCGLLTKILDRWDEWSSGQLTPDEHGDIFWGV
jgi:proteasome accessory factor A